MELTVEKALESMEETLFGYTKIIIIGEDSIAKEKGLETFTNVELFDIFSKNCLAYYTIGSYWYIIVKG